MDQLKRISSNLDIKMSKIKYKKPEPPDPSTYMQKTNNELECLRKLIRNQQAEVKELKDRLEAKTGYEKFVELDKKITLCKEKYEQLISEKRDLEKQVKDSGKILNREDIKKENGIPQFEEGKVLMLQKNENARTEQLQKKLQSEIENKSAKDAKIKEFEQSIAKIEKSLTKLKEIAQKSAEYDQNNKDSDTKKKENSQLTKEEMSAKIQELHELFETENKKNEKERLILNNQLEEIKEKYKEYEQKNKANTQKILEYSRMLKFGKLRISCLSPPPNMKDAHKKKSILAQRQELKSKYSYRKLHIRHSVFF